MSRPEKISDMVVNYVEPEKAFQINWGVTDFGFGEFFFYKDHEHGKIKIGNETLSKEFIKHILCAMVDAAELDDPPRKKE